MEPSNLFWDYDYDHHYDYDFADEDKEQCLQSCLQKRRSVDDAAGCYFQKSDGQCIFLKTGTIIGGSGDSDIGTCWKFGGKACFTVLYSCIIYQSQISTF